MMNFEEIITKKKQKKKQPEHLNQIFHTNYLLKHFLFPIFQSYITTLNMFKKKKKKVIYICMYENK